MKNMGGGGLQNIMRQANQMQLKIKKLQEELATQEYTGTSGGDAVTVKVNGSQKLVAITIKPDVMSAGDVDMLQDLIVTATNDALRVAKETSDKEMAKITGGFNMPGMF
jgi:DNA-binding YbaB/EbfC family protein